MPCLDLLLPELAALSFKAACTLPPPVLLPRTAILSPFPRVCLFLRPAMISLCVRPLCNHLALPARPRAAPTNSDTCGGRGARRGGCKGCPALRLPRDAQRLPSACASPETHRHCRPPPPLARQAAAHPQQASRPGYSEAGGEAHVAAGGARGRVVVGPHEAAPRREHAAAARLEAAYLAQAAQKGGRREGIAQGSWAEERAGVGGRGGSPQGAAGRRRGRRASFCLPADASRVALRCREGEVGGGQRGRGEWGRGRGNPARRGQPPPPPHLPLAFSLLPPPKSSRRVK